MDPDDFLICVDDLRSGWSKDLQPLGFVEIDALPESFHLPPFPLIGIGDPADVRAAQLDAVIEPPISATSVVRTVCGNPNAAAVAATLLRAIDGMPAAHALVMESLAYGLLQGSAEHARWLAAQTRRAPMREGRVRVSRRGDALDVVLDRPDARNAIDRPMRDALHDAFTIAMLDRDVRRVRLRAKGKAFSIGADLSEFGTTRDPAIAHAIRMRTLPASPLSQCAAKVEVEINGACIGAGLEMAAFAERRTATRDAWFQLPELAMGLIPGAGGCVSLSRRIGRQRALLLILSGKRVSADVALRWGLIDAIMDDDAVDESHTDGIA